MDTGGFQAPVEPSAFYGFGNGIMRYFVFSDPNWSYATYNYDNLHNDTKQAAEILSATNPDLSAFRKRGGKMIIYSGWSDAAITGLSVAGYYENVLAQDKTASDDVRLRITSYNVCYTKLLRKGQPRRNSVPHLAS